MPEFRFKLGADPEFVITLNGFKLAAREAMATYIPNFSSSLTDEHGNLGTDHNAIAEMRPTAEKDPKKLVEHMGAMIKRCADAMPWSELKTVSVWAPIGGHIHLERTSTPYQEMSERKRLSVHTALAGLSIPIIMGENHINQKLRMSGGYGSITDVRVDHTNTVEFRPLTAEWITTPHIAEATLAYMGVVWNELLYHPEHVGALKEFLPKNQEQLTAIQKLAIDEFGIITQGMLKSIHKGVKTFEMYPQFKDLIDFLFDTKAVKAEKEKVDYDMIRGWNLSKEKGRIPTKRALLSKKEAKKRIGAINIDLIKNFTKVFCTSQTSAIGLMGIRDDISKHVAAFNWSLDNRYFLFGLPKGIPSPMVCDSKGNLIMGQSLIKSQRDTETISGIFRQAVEAYSQHPAFAMKRVDLKSGKSVTDENKSLIIGIPHALRSKNDARPIIQAIYDIEKKHLEKTGVMLKEIDTTRETDGDLTAAMEAANTEDTRGGQDPSTIPQHEPLVGRQEGTAEIADLSIPSPANAYEAENSVVETEELADSPAV
jgi:hypothetical protein